jgi:hypothetical protein
MPGLFFQPYAVLITRLIPLASACWLALAAPLAAADALNELRSDVRTSLPDEPRESKPEPREEESDDWDDDDYDSDDGLTLDLFVVAAGAAAVGVTSPFWGPPVLVGDAYMQPGYFAHYPYEYDVGYMLIGPPEAAGLPGSRRPHAWAARGRAEFGTDFGGLEWTGGHVLIDTSSRWGMESDFRHVREEMATSADDAIWLGDANVLFRFAQSETIQMRAGLGANFLSDTLQSDFGFNFTYGGDWFPFRPLVLSADLDLGTLGSANLYHVRTTAGLHWGISEAYIGYDYCDIGPTQISGLVAGVRLWY